MLCGFHIITVKIARKVKQSPEQGMTIQPRNGSSGPDAKTAVNEEAETKPDTLVENAIIDDEINPERNVAELAELVNNIGIESPKKVVEEDVSKVTEDDFDENGNPIFPHESLAKLDEMVNKPKWIIPVLPKAELEILVDATIKLAKKGKIYHTF